jgi:hypothetical protein
VCVFICVHIILIHIYDIRLLKSLNHINHHFSFSSIFLSDLIPLNCTTSLEERWIAFFEILLNQSTKIIFNFQLTLLPILAAYYGLRDGLSIASRLSGYIHILSYEHEILHIIQYV